MSMSNEAMSRRKGTIRISIRNVLGVLAVFQIAPWPGTREKCFLQGVGPAEVDGYAMVTWRILAA